MSGKSNSLGLYLIRAVILGSIVMTLSIISGFNSYADTLEVAVDPFELDEIEIVAEGQPVLEIDDDVLTIVEDVEEVEIVTVDSATVEEEVLEVDEVAVVEEAKVAAENLSSVISNAEKSSGTGRSLGRFRLTSYCGCRKCNGKWTGHPTALGTTLTTGRTIAVDKRVIPLGTWVEINVPGIGWQKFRAEDTGSAVKGNHIDVYVGTNHSDCYNSYYNGYAEVRLAQ